MDAGDDAGFDGGQDAGNDAGFDGGEDAGNDAGFDGGGFDAGWDGGCSTELPDDSLGYYVSGTNGDDSSGAGTRIAPYKTIGRALTALNGQSPQVRNTVYVHALGAATPYYESILNIQDKPFGVFVYGGWNVASATNVWTRECSANFRDLTVVQSSAITAVAASNVTHDSGLKALTVRSATPTAGLSSTGVFVTGANSRFSLKDVRVQAQAGSDAPNPTFGPPNTTPNNCNGLSDCNNGSSGFSGSTGSAGSAGSFGAGGYTATSGQVGGLGSNGNNGQGGTNGSSASCATTPCVATGPSTCAPTSTTIQGSPGQCGCGGGRGAGGTGGIGGGASVALLVINATAVVTLENVALVSGSGGRGSDGANGQPGGSGTAGAAGAAAMCTQAICTFDDPMDGGATSCVASSGATINAAGGNPGTAGGIGGTGGKGGGGAGGPSYGLVRVGGPTVNETNVTITNGSGGLGGNGAPSGQSAARGSF